MKLNFALNSKTFKSLLHKKGSSNDRSASHPGRDWLIVISGAIFLLIISLGYHVYLFMDVNAVHTPKDTAAVQPVPVDQQTLNKILSRLADREAQFTTLQSVAPSVPDPSR